MSFLFALLNQAVRGQRFRPAVPSKRPAGIRPFAELLETRNLLSKTVLDSEHVHFEANFTNGAWQKFDLLDDTHGVTYKTGQVILSIGPEDLTTQQPGYDFVGAGQGNSFYETPLDTNNTTPYTSIAFETENIPTGTFQVYQPRDPRVARAGEWIKWQMLAVDGPGYVSVWRDNQIPNGQWWMSSYDGGRTFDSAIYIESGGHIHVHWGFTQPGVYQVTFQASAYVSNVGLPLYSRPVKLTFNVDTGSDTSGGRPLQNAVAAIGVFSTPSQQSNPARALSAGSSSPNSALVNPPVAGALILDTGNVDAAFAATTSSAQESILVLGTAQQVPGSLGASLGDVLGNQDTL